MPCTLWWRSCLHLAGAVYASKHAHTHSHMHTHPHLALGSDLGLGQRHFFWGDGQAQGATSQHDGICLQHTDTNTHNSMRASACSTWTHTHMYCCVQTWTWATFLNDRPGPLVNDLRPQAQHWDMQPHMYYRCGACIMPHPAPQAQAAQPPNPRVRLSQAVGAISGVQAPCSGCGRVPTQPPHCGRVPNVEVSAQQKVPCLGCRCHTQIWGTAASQRGEYQCADHRLCCWSKGQVPKCSLLALYCSKGQGPKRGPQALHLVKGAAKGCSHSTLPQPCNNAEPALGRRSSRQRPAQPA